jgi:hypothetical protein
VPQAERKQTQSLLRLLNDFVQSVLDEVSDHRHGAFSFAHCRQLSKAELNEVRRDFW